MRRMTPAEFEHVWNRLDAAPVEVEAKVPPHTLAGIRDYVLQGIPPCCFLRCVLENDLMGAVNNADPKNRAGLADIVAYLNSYCPAACWGRKGVVEEWTVNFRREEVRA